jgi:sortase (surface protein transpeptidase)
MEASAPVRVVIPSIGVDTALMDLGLMPDGTLEVPPDGTLAGWYTGAPTPGERGPAIIAGHVDWHGPAVFHHLALMVPGDTIDVTRADGTIAVFAVSEVAQYPKAAFPTEAVYGDVDVAAIRLITCGGVFNRSTGHYDDNIVVYAELVTP